MKAFFQTLKQLASELGARLAGTFDDGSKAAVLVPEVKAPEVPVVALASQKAQALKQQKIKEKFAPKVKAQNRALGNSAARQASYAVSKRSR